LLRSIFIPIFLVIVAASPAAFSIDPPATQPISRDQFIIIPLRIHILQSPDITDIDCKLSDADIQRILGKINGIWHQAGIHFGLHSILREPAAMQPEFAAARAHDPASLAPFRMIRPDESRKFDGLHVYYIHQFPVNGVYMGQDFAFVKETASLRRVEGGIDEPIPRVTAHELGHALGLPHRQNLTNLLASGTTGTSINAAEIAIARGKAAKINGAAPVAEWQTRAADALSKSDSQTATRIKTWLAGLPDDPSKPAEQANRPKN
jgi:hypothetical protein